MDSVTVRYKVCHVGDPAMGFVSIQLVPVYGNAMGRDSLRLPAAFVREFKAGEIIDITLAKHPKKGV